MSGNICSSVMSANSAASEKFGFPEAAGVHTPSLTTASVHTPSFTASDGCHTATSEKTARHPRSLLLHVCCGPCAIMPITRLLDEGFAVTAWYMNPNIQPLAEYLRRRDAAAECAQRLGIPILYDDASWNITAWLRAVAGRDTAPQRCAYCCTSRIEAAFAAAARLGFAFVSSSLLYSRYQPHDIIHQAGIRLAQTAAAGQGPDFVYRDFRTDWQEGIDRSKVLELYRQPYCGCIYSEAERYEKKLARLIKN